MQNCVVLWKKVPKTQTKSRELNSRPEKKIKSVQSTLLTHSSQSRPDCGPRCRSLGPQFSSNNYRWDGRPNFFYYILCSLCLSGTTLWYFMHTTFYSIWSRSISLHTEHTTYVYRVPTTFETEIGPSMRLSPSCLHGLAIAGRKPKVIIVARRIWIGRVSSGV